MGHFLHNNMNKFVLLNNQGDTLDKFYIEFNSVPSQSNEVGACRYVDARGTTDEINFKLSEDKLQLTSWQKNRTNDTFEINLIVDNNELFGLEVKFDNTNIAYFALEPESYDFDVSMTPVSPITSLL